MYVSAYLGFVRTQALNKYLHIHAVLVNPLPPHVKRGGRGAFEALAGYVPWQVLAFI